MRTETLTRKIYTFDELDDTAKERAREWCRQDQSEYLHLDYDWFDFIYDYAQRVAEILGIEFDAKHIPLMDGTTRPEPKIWFSGFWTQGSGASFEGSYRYARGAAKRIRAYAPNDKILHGIADDLQSAQKNHLYQLEASCSHRGRYYNSGSMAVVGYHREDSCRDIGDAEITIEEALRDFADWIYKSLEAEYDWLLADEQIDDSIRANEWEFDVDGVPA